MGSVAAGQFSACDDPFVSLFLEGHKIADVRSRSGFYMRNIEQGPSPLVVEPRTGNVRAPDPERRAFLPVISYLECRLCFGGKCAFKLVSGPVFVIEVLRDYRINLPAPILLAKGRLFQHDVRRGMGRQGEQDGPGAEGRQARPGKRENIRKAAFSATESADGRILHHGAARREVGR